MGTYSLLRIVKIRFNFMCEMHLCCLHSILGTMTAETRYHIFDSAQQIFMECLLCVRYCKFGGEEKSKKKRERNWRDKSEVCLSKIWVN